MAAAQKVYNDIKRLKCNVSSEEIAEIDICCKSVIDKYLNDADKIDANAIAKIHGVVDYMYEQVNVGDWKAVKLCLRKSITISCYLKLLALLKFTTRITEKTLIESFKIIDFGILFGCPLDEKPKLLQECATYLNSLGVEKHIPVLNLLNTQSQTTNSSDKFKCAPIEVVNCPSMESFYTNYILAEKPVILNGCIDHWPALEKWQDQNYFIKLAGPRTVSVELGKVYTESNWAQELMSFEDFIVNHISKSNNTTGYLAQYHLFDHIPELRDDIVEPEYCCFSDKNEPVSVMAWFGPKGTLSPLHVDAKRNLFAQVIGEKQIFLLSPKDSEYVYPHTHELLRHTAKVDPRQPDLERFPEYKNATPYYCVLKAGQMLYIPPKWWHFVESLSVSFSVSFWWE